MASVRLTRPQEEVRKAIDAAEAEGHLLLDSVPNDPALIPRFRQQYLAWESKTAAVLENAFDSSGFLSSSPKDEFNGTAVSLLDLKISATTIPAERLPEVVSDIREKVRVLESIRDRLAVYTQFSGPAAPDPSLLTRPSSSSTDETLSVARSCGGSLRPSPIAPWSCLPIRRTAVKTFWESC